MSFQLSAFSFQFSVLSSRFSVLGSQFSVLSSQFSVLGSQFPVVQFFLSPLRGLMVPGNLYPRLASWAAFFRRFAASHFSLTRGFYPHRSRILAPSSPHFSLPSRRFPAFCGSANPEYFVLRLSLAALGEGDV